MGVALAATALLAAACSSGGSDSTEPTGAPAPTGSVAPEANGVPAALVGMHVEGAEAGAWPSAPFGSLRLWDNGTAWSQIELEPGVYKWDNLEGVLENAQSKGMTDVLMVLGTTPEWNTDEIGPDDYPQPGAASPPKDLKAWDAWVTEVATRYKGRISAYQIWNEANLKNFWNGTPEQMADLTKRAYDIIKAIDPEALVVSASPSTRLTASFDKFFPAYLEALAAADWPVDVIAIHTYPTADGDPVARGAVIQKVQDALTAAGAPDLQLWDTELNYGLAGPGDLPRQEITGAKAAGWVVRTYIDDLRYGVDRSYWYIWTQRPYDLLGIQAYPGSDGEQGFFALDNWVIGASFDGCTTDDAGAVVCTFSKAGTTWTVAWAESGEAPYTAPEGTKLVCDPLANCTESSGGAAVTLTEVPVRFYTQ
jgi:hypothetical protein